MRGASTAVLSAAMAVVGVALVVRMALIGNPVGIVLGVLLTAAGAGRLFVALRGPR